MACIQAARVVYNTVYTCCGPTSVDEGIALSTVQGLISNHNTGWSSKKVSHCQLISKIVSSCSCSCVVCLRIHMCVYLFVYFYTIVWLVSCVLPNIGEINLIYLVKHFCQRSCATVCYTTVDTFLFFHVYYMPVPGDTGGNVSVYSAIWTTIVSRQYNSSQENLWKLKKIYFQCMIIPSVDSFKLREKTLLCVTTVFCDIYKWKTTLGALRPF